MSDPRSPSCYCTATRKAARIITRHYDAALAPSGLRCTQFALLNNLRRLGPTSINALSETMLLERTTLLRNLDLLARKKLVEILPDAKAHRIRLTPQGEEERAGALPLWEKAQRSMDALLAPEEQDFLRQLASRLSALRQGL
jgi:DNA-binding MarR family transcriptional regulator